MNRTGRALASKETDQQLAFYYRMEQGVSLLFWGGVVTTLLVSGLLRLDSVRSLGVPPYMAGGLIMLAGVFQMRQAGCGIRCERLLTYGWWLCVLAVYFMPFYFWWDAVPFRLFMLLNVLTGVYCMLFFLVAINGALGEMNSHFSEYIFRMQCVFGAYSVIVLQVVPVSVMVILTLLRAARSGNHVLFELQRLLGGVPFWGLALLIIPVTITLANCWCARGLCRERIIHRLT